MTPAAESGPHALKAVREAMIRKGWSRQHCNAQVRRLGRAFKWAAGEELIPITVHTALKTVAPEVPPRLPSGVDSP